jgi:hypothetical protein
MIFLEALAHLHAAEPSSARTMADCLPSMYVDHCAILRFSVKPAGSTAGLCVRL